MNVVIVHTGSIDMVLASCYVYRTCLAVSGRLCNELRACMSCAVLYRVGEAVREAWWSFRVEHVGGTKDERHTD